MRIDPGTGWMPEALAMGGWGIQGEVPCRDGACGAVGIERWISAGTVPLATARHTAFSILVFSWPSMGRKNNSGLALREPG